MVIHVDADRTDLVLVRAGSLVFSRSLSQGVGEWQTGPEGLGPLAQELERSLSGLHKEWPGIDANTVVLTGLGPLEEWKGFLEQRIGKPIIARSVSGHLKLPAISGSSSGSLAVVLGLAMAEERQLVNLMPPMARQAQSQRRRMRELAVTGLLLLAALAVGAGLLMVHVRRQKAFVQRVTRALRDLESTTRQTERQEQDVALIEAVVASRRWTAAMLEELVRLTPPEILFESLIFERARGELVVRGSAPTTRHVLDYKALLQQSPNWDRVDLRYSSRRTVSAEARTDFEMVLHQSQTS